MITYGLGTITYKSKDEQHQHLPGTPSARVNIPIGLSKDEFEEIETAILSIGIFTRYADLFNTVQWNFEDLIATVQSYLKAFIKKDVEIFRVREITLNINKDLLNVLSAFRFYLDYMDRSLKNDFSNSLELVAKFNDYCSQEYNNNFSYRFIYHLRNYAQHKGFIVSSVELGENFGKENQFQINYHLNVNVGKQEIVRDKNLKKELKIEIENLPEKINMIEHVNRCLASLAKIHKKITYDLLYTTLDAATLIQSHIKKLSYSLVSAK